MHNLGYVVAGYTVTGLALAAYVGSLLSRVRRARLRAAAVAAVAARRRPVSPPPHRPGSG